MVSSSLCFTLRGVWFLIMFAKQPKRKRSGDTLSLQLWVGPDVAYVPPNALRWETS